jgi:hypothetical protein
MRIITEKTLVCGKKYRRIIGFEGLLDHFQLPKEYGETYPHICAVFPSSYDYTPGALCVAYGVFDFKCLTRGNVYGEEFFQTQLKTIREAAKRLAKINKKLRWEGREDFII